MATRSSPFWGFILVLVLLHLVLRLALGLTVVPDLLVVAALLGARRLGAPGAALLGLVLGVIADSLAVVAFGATAVAFVIVCYLGSRTRNLFEGDSYLFAAIYVFIGAWLIFAIRFLVGGFMARSQETLLQFAGSAALDSLHVAAAAVVSLIAFRAITGRR